MLQVDSSDVLILQGMFDLLKYLIDFFQDRLF